MTSPGGRITVAVLPRIEAEPYLRSVFTDNDHYVGVSATKDVIRNGAFDILHIQWPESFLTGDFRRRAASTSRLLRAIWTARRRSKPIVVTIHNLKPHDGNLSRLNRRLVRFQFESASAVIVLTSGGVKRARNAFPELTGRRVEVIPHPHWVPEYAPPENWDAIRTATRERLGVPDDAVLFSMLGSVRPYKRVPEVVQLWSTFDSEHAYLYVGGRFTPSEWDRLPSIPRHAHVTIENRRIDEREYRDVLLATDVAVFNFSDIENSGSLIAALTAGCVTLAPDIGALRQAASSYTDARGSVWTGRSISHSDLRDAAKIAASQPHKGSAIGELNEDTELRVMHGAVYRTLQVDDPSRQQLPPED